MEFIRSLDDDENGTNPPSTTGVTADTASFSSTLDNYSHATWRRPSYQTQADENELARSRRSLGHQPIKHRPTKLHELVYDQDEDEDEQRDEADQFSTTIDSSTIAAASPPVDVPVSVLAARAFRQSQRAEVVGARPAEVSSTIRAFQARQAAQLAARDTGDYFRENEEDAIDAKSGFRAGVGPGAHVAVAQAQSERSTLAKLNGYKTRDLFASQGRRVKASREKVIVDSMKHPAGFRYRAPPSHPLTNQDFAEVTEDDPGYDHGDPFTDPNSAFHPEVRLGAHKFRPTAEEKRLEQSISELSATHMKHRLADQTLRRSIQNKVAEFSKLQERREEESIRKQEESYRQLFEQQEKEAIGGSTTKSTKSRPISAPVHRMATEKKPSGSSSLLPPQESDEEQYDSRTAMSHPDFRLLQEQEQAKLAAAAAGENSERPSGFSQRPTTASRLRQTRWADEAARSGTITHQRTSPSHAKLSSSSSALSLTQTPTTATELLHRHRPGSAALSVYSSTSATTAPAATSLPLPIPTIDHHFKQEAWSQARREEYEIDQLTRGMADLAPVIPDGGDEDEGEVVFEDSIAGAAAARIKHENKKAERRRQLEEQREKARQARHEAREKLKFKTEVWEAHRLGIVQLDETEKDHTLAAIKSRQLAMVRAGIPLAKVPTHDVAFNSSVVKRKTAPPPKVRVKKSDAAAAADTEDKTKDPSTPSKQRASSGFGQKKPIVIKGRPASASQTLQKLQSIQNKSNETKFIEGLYNGILAETVESLGPDPPINNSLSLYRSEQDKESKKTRTRPFSATPSFSSTIDPSGKIPLQVVPTSGQPLAQALSTAPPAATIRPATASLLGHSASNPALLKTAKSRATVVGNVISHVHGHMDQYESLRTVDAITDAFARSMSRSESVGGGIKISRATLERALIPPRIYLNAEQQKQLPMQIANIPVNPFLEPKKKKKKLRRKGSSKKKKGSSSTKKSKVTEAEGLSFPKGTATSEFASNPLVSDLSLININDLATPDEKPIFRNLYLKNAQSLILIFDFYSTRSPTSGMLRTAAPPLMSQFKWLQFLTICGVFTQPPNSTLPPVTSRQALQIFADDDDLSVENMDVDELISRPAFLERLARVAVLRCGQVAKLPPAPLGEVQPVQPKPIETYEALEVFLNKFVLPNAMSVAAGDIRMRLLDDKTQSVFQLNNIPLQTMFSQYAGARLGTLSYESFKLLLKDCDIPVNASYVEKSLVATFNTADLNSIQIFYPELLELFGRIADAATGSSDLSSGLAAFLLNAWTSFTKSVPSALSVAAAIAASHQESAQNATGTGGSKTNTPRDTKIRFG